MKVLKRAKGVSPFPKGLVHGFCPKIELFLCGVFQRNYIRKNGFWYCGKKRMMLKGKNSNFLKGQKINLF